MIALFGVGDTLAGGACQLVLGEIVAVRVNLSPSVSVADVLFREILATFAITVI